MDFCFRYEVPSYQNNISVDSEQLAVCSKINNTLNSQLTSWKNKLNHNKHWDTAKRISNKYEFIFSSGYNKFNLVKKKPLSRAYFKLWEILHDFDIIQKNVKTNSAHIADGPGGFIECVCDYFEKYNHEHTSIHGITLRSTDRKIPNWKVSKEHLCNFNIGLYDGCIYDRTVINDFIETVGNHSAEFVTADGGFDFSKDFNNQEKQCYKLMFCEVYIALRIQKNKGNFLLKVFDLFSSETITLLAMCSSFYKNMYVIKPNTSRPANSEKYLLFTNYIQDMTVTHHELLDKLFDEIDKETYSIDENTIHNFENFYSNITRYNIVYTMSQISHLKDTLELSRRLNEKTRSRLVEENLKLCKQWCLDYNIHSSS